MQRNYRQITPTHTTRPYKMGKSANSQEKGRLLVVPYFLTALLALMHANNGQVTPKTQQITTFASVGGAA